MRHGLQVVPVSSARLAPLCGGAELPSLNDTQRSPGPFALCWSLHAASTVEGWSLEHSDSTESATTIPRPGAKAP